MPPIYIGTSGWSYDHWHGVLYPDGMPARDRLAVYVRHFGTVELNASYYRWPPDHRFASWRRRTPPGFLMTVKAPGLLTHVKRLYAPERWLTRIRLGIRRLDEKQGILLVQCSPHFAYDHARLAYFLDHAHDLPLALEFRHPSWHRDEVFELLERHGDASYCVISGAGLPCILRATGPFVYVRLHGSDPHHLYAGSYSDDDLRWWTDRIREWQDQDRAVFAYFNNDGHGHAVRNARRLRELLGA